jgi:ribose 5-phosphate isomerase B
VLAVTSKTVAIASDHAGFPMKEALKQELTDDGYTVLDLGTSNEESVDYPDYGKAVGEAVADGRAARGVAVCGSGVGISIAVNRVPGARGALVHDRLGIELARQHNDANVMVLGGRTTGIAVAKDCLRTFLATEFEGGRHAGRIEKLG